MLKEVNVKREKAVIAVETRDHLSNGVSPKNQISRRNQLKGFVVILIGFTLTIFQSCDKAKELDGTSWEGEFHFYDNDYEDSYDYDVTINISFTEDNVDIVAKLKSIEFGNENYKASGTFRCERKNITIDIKRWWGGRMPEHNDWVEDVGGRKWSGTFNEKTMTLRNVFRETVILKK